MKPLSQASFIKQAVLVAAAWAVCAACSSAEPTHRLFVTNEGDNTLSVIDTRTGELEATLEVGNRPRGIGLSPDRKHVYVANGDDNALAVVDVRSLEIVKTISAGSDPEAFAVHPNGRIYLSNEDEGKASVVDPRSGEILAEIPVGIEPEGVGISPTASSSWSPANQPTWCT